MRANCCLNDKYVNAKTSNKPKSVFVRPPLHKVVVVNNANGAVHINHTLSSCLFLCTTLVWSGLWPDDMKVTGQVSCHTVTQTFRSCLPALSPLLPRPFVFRGQEGSCVGLRGVFLCNIIVSNGTRIPTKKIPMYMWCPFPTRSPVTQVTTAPPSPISVVVPFHPV